MSIELLIDGRPRDLGGFSVRRLLPSGVKQMVGPFIFFDHIGPAQFAPDHGIDVRPHPHIALATVTYLYSGALMHRDNLGFVQEIRPGDVNWMTAGRGIAHSERTPSALRRSGSSLHGIQSWVALPDGHEEVEAAFHHHPADTLPQFEAGGATLRVIAGEAYGRRSPVAVLWPTLYVDVAMVAGSTLEVLAEHEERAVYVAEGSITLDDQPVVTAQLAILASGKAVSVHARSSTRLMLFGGARFPTARHIWWNFVASSPERIEQAKLDWTDGRFAAVPGETDFIPLPER